MWGGILWGAVLNGGNLGMSENSFGCPNCGGGVTGILWVETRHAAKHLTMHEAAPHQRIIRPSVLMVPMQRKKSCCQVRWERQSLVPILLLFF